MYFTLIKLEMISMKRVEVKIVRSKEKGENTNK